MCFARTEELDLITDHRSAAAVAIVGVNQLGIGVVDESLGFLPSDRVRLGLDEHLLAEVCRLEEELSLIRKGRGIRHSQRQRELSLGGSDKKRR